MDFLNQFNNHSVDYDGVYGAQCFDLIQEWNVHWLGNPFIKGQYAYQIYKGGMHYEIQNRNVPADPYGKGGGQLALYNLPVTYIVWKSSKMRGQLIGMLEIKYPNGKSERRYVWASADESSDGRKQKARGQMYWDVVHNTQSIWDMRSSAGRESTTSLESGLSPGSAELVDQVHAYYDAIDKISEGT